MAEPKTKPTATDPAAFLAAVPDERRADAEALYALMAEVTGVPAVMWGGSIVGFGRYHYRYASGRGGDWPPVGFSPRKQALTLYVAEGFEPHRDLLARLGPHTTGKGCLYVKRLAALDQAVLRELVERGFAAYDGKTITA
ncbi:hypothetical protein F4556_004226 [Kitasatospora gansuensis]|uniref:YdhG-like domain-containing protein n=1 Tax=Kitasatospora gansuensis TaxID=258050 RepID=A0A7W7WIX6_9ACTN|nr:DUF1801 domain-containing protein [Kitasatospora gansuensis]MBB4948691.1 hypothetical protein [Kitasatospora gansuensis]